jgi:carboxylesterase type B
LGEQLWSPESKTASIQANLDYLKYQGKIGNSSLWVAPSGDKPQAIGLSGSLAAADSSQRLPVLCTQSAPFSNGTTEDTSEKWQVSVHSNNEDYTGFRDRLAFRFHGIRYAPEPKRFTYSVPYKGSGKSVSALEFSTQCMQGGSGSEDCLFLNVWTPYLPKPGCKPKKGSLKPVMIWIHGGAFTGGTANENTFDGGNLASRGDVVMVGINYRLSTLGYLALNDGVTNGNFGLGDQINALDWVRANIKDFGGDPDQITVFGQSAGAGSVRAMMASPKAIGKFAGAIQMSNLGGINYGTTYSKYYTIEEEVKEVAEAILDATNCTAATSQVDCLRDVSAATLTSMSTVARFLVVDGTYLTSDELELDGPRLPVTLMMGTMRDDGGPFINYPTTTNTSEYLAASGFDAPPADLFPIPAGANKTLDLYNMTTRLATDGIFRCVDQATAKHGTESGRLGPVYYYEIDRSYQALGWPMTDVCEPPRTADFPNGDPTLPYFRCHSGELYYVFGNIAYLDLPDRDGKDTAFERFMLDSFTAFARTRDPNPDAGFLAARGFDSTSEALKASGGRWEPTADGKTTMRVLDWPSYQAPFRELDQCEGLGLGLGYFD